LRKGERDELRTNHVSAVRDANAGWNVLDAGGLRIAVCGDDRFISPDDGGEAVANGG